MPLLLQKYRVPHRWLLRDVRPASQRIAESIEAPFIVACTAFIAAIAYAMGVAFVIKFADFLFLFLALYFWWAAKRPFKLGLKFPKYANLPDANNPRPGKPGAGKSAGILYLGNADDPGETTYQQELWLTNEDARTHFISAPPVRVKPKG
jgi:hypothetical protein